MDYCKLRTDFCNSVIFNSLPVFSNLFSRALAGVSRASTTTNGVFSFVFHNFFGFLPRSKYFSIFSTGQSCVIRYSDVNYLKFMVFFIDDNQIRPSCNYKMLFLHSKVPKMFTRVILNDSLCLMLIPFWFNMDSIYSTNLPMHLSSNPIMPSFILLLNKFATFTYSVVNCLISPITHSALRLLF